MIPDAPRALAVAARLCREAGAAVMALRGGPLKTERKADRSLVTDADRAANDILRAGLRAAFPDHGLLSEETGYEGPAGAAALWMIDPIDGTRAYAEGRAGFCVMAGLVADGAPVLGVVFDPLEDRLYEAVKGGGAFQTRAGGPREPLRAGSEGRPEAWRVLTSTGLPESVKARLAPRFPGPWLPPVNSVGVKVGVVARGDADVYFNHHAVHVWDTAGPQVILEEAGGRITLWDGAPLAYDPARPRLAGPTLAASAAAHAAAVARLK